MALADNLVAYWPLDEASGNAIDVHNGNNLTETAGTIASAAGVVSNARDFEDGDTEYFEIADNTDLSTGDIDFTFAAWVRLESDPGADIITKFDPGGGVTDYLFGYTASQFRFIVVDSGGSNTTITATNFGTISTATWYFVVMWHNAGTNEIGICVNDGTPDTASYSAGVRDTTAPFRIGARGNDTNYFDGQVDNVGFWKRVLTGAEITELYNAGAGRDYAYITGGGGGTTPKNVFGKMLSGPFGGAV